MIRRSPILASTFGILLASAPARAQAPSDKGNVEGAPTLIREHGTGSPGATAGANSASSAAPTAAPAKKAEQSAESTLIVEVREEEAPEDADEPDASSGTESASQGEDGPPPGSAMGGPSIDTADVPLRYQREPLLDEPWDGGVSWQRHGEVGAALAWLSRPFANARGAVPMSYRPTVGVGLHLQWELRPWLHMRPYFLWGAHTVDLQPGALSTSTPNSIRTDSLFEAITASTFSFGAKVAPTWNLSPRVRLWLVAGVGYGRATFRGVTLTEPGGTPFTVPDRDGAFIEFPVGLGGAYEILPGRAAFTVEVTGAPAVAQTGSAYEPSKVVDPDGKLRELGAFGAIQASFAQTLGLSIYL